MKCTRAQRWLHGGHPPTGMKIYAFYIVVFLLRMSFRTREYYVPLTMTRHTPPPKFSGAVPGHAYPHLNESVILAKVSLNYLLLKYLTIIYLNNSYSWPIHKTIYLLLLYSGLLFHTIPLIHVHDGLFSRIFVFFYY